MTKYWLLLTGMGGKLHALQDAYTGKALCGMERFGNHDRGYGAPTCKRCLEMLDEIKAEQEEELDN